MTQELAKTLVRIQELASAYVESLGLSLWGLEMAGGESRPTLRVFIDGPEGVDVEACASVSRQLSLALDMEDLMHGAYHLEVSSPGLERRFFDFAQLAPYLGRELDLTLAEPLEGRKRFKGTLDALDDARLSLTCEGKPVRVAWEHVAKARLVHRFETPEESKARARTRGAKKSKESQAAPGNGD